MNKLSEKNLLKVDSKNNKQLFDLIVDLTYKVNELIDFSASNQVIELPPPNDGEPTWKGG